MIEILSGLRFLLGSAVPPQADSALNFAVSDRPRAARPKDLTKRAFGRGPFKRPNTLYAINAELSCISQPTANAAARHSVPHCNEPDDACLEC
jgi:hypothetical protein